MKNQKGFIKILLIIIAIIAVVLFVYMRTGNKTETIPRNITDNKIDSGFQASEKDITADWKTYRNDKYGFEVKYPGNADIKELDYSEPGAIRFNIDFGPISNDEPVRIFVHDKDMEGLMLESVNVKETETITINGAHGSKIVGVDQKGLSVNEIWLKNNDKIYLLKGQGYIFNQFLSTFKFTK